MERLTKWENGHAYYPRCFEQPCYGGGCKLKDCPFETAVCERLAAYEDTGLTPDQVVNAKNIIDLAFAEDTSKAERIRKLIFAEDFERAMASFPGDAIQIVRCRDCKWFADNNDGEWYGCQMFQVVWNTPEDAPKPDDFCSYGERREE